MNIKNIALIIPCIITVTYTNTAHGTAAISGPGEIMITRCTEVTCPANISNLQALDVEENKCAQHSSIKRCFKKDDTTYTAHDCISCKPGYTYKNTAVESCTDGTLTLGGGYNGPAIPHCECICNNCTSTDWTNSSKTGYQSRTVAECECSSGTATCNKTPEYQCAAGYYGSSSNGTSGCNPCPEWTGVYTNSARTISARGTTSSAGATTITKCHVISGTYYDVTGTFKTSGNCPYKN